MIIDICFDAIKMSGLSMLSLAASEIEGDRSRLISMCVTDYLEDVTNSDVPISYMWITINAEVSMTKIREWVRNIFGGPRVSVMRTRRAERMITHIQIKLVVPFPPSRVSNNLIDDHSLLITAPYFSPEHRIRMKMMIQLFTLTPSTLTRKRSADDVDLISEERDELGTKVAKFELRK